MTKRSKVSGGISRRDFLRDAGLLAGGAAIGSSVLLSACGGDNGGETETATTTTTDSPSSSSKCHVCLLSVNFASVHLTRSAVAITLVLMSDAFM